MAAAALLRSVARRMARAPPPHPCPLLARGLHGSARSGLGASLPPPPATTNGIQDERVNRLLAGMAAAGLPSFAPKMMVRAQPPHHHLHLHGRGLSSGTSANQSLRPAEKFAYFLLVVSAVWLYCFEKPMIQELDDSINALNIEKETLKKAVEECRRKHTHVLADSSQAQSMQAEAWRVMDNRVR